MQYFYVYKVILPRTGEYYFGSRKTTTLPIDDIKYKGSMCTWKPDKSRLVKFILYEFDTHQEALHKETELIIEHRKDPLNKNFSLPNGTLYLNSPKEWIIKKYGEVEGNERLKKIYLDNRSIWRKGNKPHNTGKHLSTTHIDRIIETWHSIKRIELMQSIEYKEKMSVSLSGEKNPMFNKSIYDVWYIKYGKEIADKKLNEWKTNKKGQIAWNKGISASNESKMRNSLSNSNRCWIFNDNLKKSKRIKLTELEKFINDGWTKGRKNY